MNVRAAHPRAANMGRAIEIGFHVLGWSAVTLLASAGLFMAGFAALGNFTLDGFFFQLANLADRYAAADAGRRAGFGVDFVIAMAIALSATMFLRRGSLVRAIANDGKD